VKEDEERKLNDLVNAPRLVRGASLTKEEIDEKTKDVLGGIDSDIDFVVDLTCKFVLELNHMQGLVKKLNGQFRDFRRLLILGARAQTLLKEQLEIQEQFETLTKKKHELEAKQIAGAPVYFPISSLPFLIINFKHSLSLLFPLSSPQKNCLK